MVQAGTKVETFRMDSVALPVVFRHLLRHIQRHILHIHLRRKRPGNITIADQHHLLEESR